VLRLASSTTFALQIGHLSSVAQRVTPPRHVRAVAQGLVDRVQANPKGLIASLADLTCAEGQKNVT
jgi:hypothetical protein